AVDVGASPPFVHEFYSHHSEDIRVEFHLIGGNPFLQIGDDLISVEELKRYRKVYVANSLLLYSTNAFVSLIQLTVSLFTHSWGVIVPCFLSFVATLCLLYSLRMVSKSYLWFAGGSIIVQEVSISVVLMTILYLNSITSVASTVVILFSLFSFITLSSLLLYAQRLQTIYRIVPLELIPQLK
ncbi:hypothetical protein WA538_005867, partial [Blastocystis sp. DL]